MRERVKKVGAAICWKNLINLVKISLARLKVSSNWSKSGEESIGNWGTMENTYGIGIANRYELFYGQEDVSDNFETVVSKKKKDKKELVAPGTTATPATVVPAKSGAEKENKAQPKVSATGGQQATAKTAQEPRKDQRKGIKEQNTTRKDNGESMRSIFERFWGFFTKNVLAAMRYKLQVY